MRTALLWTNLRFHRGTVIAWGVCLILYGLLLVSLYGSMGTGSYVDIINDLPEEMKALMGISGSVTSPEGILSLETWIGIEYLSWWPALLAVYAIFFCGGIVAREVERGTMDLLLSQPLRRYQVVTSKFGVFLIGLVAITAISYLGVALGLVITGYQASYGSILLVFIQGLFLLLAIGTYTTLFSCLFLEPRKAMMVAGLVTAGFYILNFMSPSLGSFEWLGKLSIFYHFRPIEIMQNVALNATGLAIYGAIAVICFAASLFIFERRDIAA